jgi:transposase
MKTIHVIAHDTAAELLAELRCAHDEAFKTRVKVIRLALSDTPRCEIAEQLMVDLKSVTSWVKRYNERGISGLATHKGGRPEGNPKWDKEPFDALAQEIDKGGYWSVPRMQEWLKQKYKKDIPEQTIWYRMDQLKYSYKSARPHPTQGNRERQETFKKGASPHSWSKG